ncbi:MAG: outer membrane protein assembly factor BamB [Pseudomonadota bacterium]
MKTSTRAMIEMMKLPVQFARTVCVAVFVATLAGCSFFGGDKKLAPLTEIRDSAISLQWSASAGNPKGYRFTPGLGDKVIYTAAHDGSINAIAEQGGRNVSRIDAKTKLSAGVGFIDETIVVANMQGEVMAFDASGRSLWKTPLGGEILAAPLVDKTSVIARTADGRMYALNRADGKRKWIFTRTAPALTLRTSASVIVSRGVIYAGYPGGKLVAIELETGRPVWEATLSLPRGTTELERIADVAGLPVIDNSRVCAAVYQGRTGCVESLSGNVLWTRDISSADGVAVDAKYLYVADTDGNLSALDKTSGSTVWKQDKLQHRDLGTPAIVKGRVLLGDKLGMVHCIAPDSGELTGRITTDGSRVVSLVVNGDRVIAQTEKGGVFAISVR